MRARRSEGGRYSVSVMVRMVSSPMINDHLPISQRLKLPFIVLDVRE